MDLEKSKTLKRRLRRERMAMEKVGDFLPFTPRSTPVVPQSNDQPKMTNSAKRAARKRKKAAAWQQEVEGICSGSISNPAVLLKEHKELDNLKSKSNSKKRKKRKKLSEGEKPTPSDMDATSISTENIQEGSGLDNSNIEVGLLSENNGETTTGKYEETNGLSKEPKKDLPPRKKRFVLFVGNLSYETTEEDVMEHFKKIGSITSVRIAKHKDSNSCRGFCHLEVRNEETYLKALSLHHTFMAKRRINVEYSSGRSEEKGEAKRKNFKLQTLNKTGCLGGSMFNPNRSGNTVKLKPAEKVRGAFFV